MSDNTISYENASKPALEIGVMGSARLTEDDERWKQAHQLGELLAREGYAVVTGGYGGLMAAVSQGAHEKGGSVIGLTMQHWQSVTPNRWNATLRWSTDYGTRINHIIRCDAVIALPGGVGTLAELMIAWSASQTEGRALPLVLLGACWPRLMEAIRANLVVSDTDLNLLRFAESPAEALRAIQIGLHDTTWMGSSPHG